MFISARNTRTRVHHSHIKTTSANRSYRCARGGGGGVHFVRLATRRGVTRTGHPLPGACVPLPSHRAPPHEEDSRRPCQSRLQAIEEATAKRSRQTTTNTITSSTPHTGKETRGGWGAGWRKRKQPVLRTVVVKVKGNQFDRGWTLGGRRQILMAVVKVAVKETKLINRMT